MEELKDKYAFCVDWYDPSASLVRKYCLIFNAVDSTVELYDLKTKKVFLKRTKVDNVTLADLYVGSTINLFSRQLNVTDYGNSYTKKELGSCKETTFGMIKPDAVCKMGEIIDLIMESGLLITKLKKITIDRSEAVKFYEPKQTDPNFSNMVNFLISGPVIAMELLGDGAVCKWREMVGPTDPAEARSTAPRSMRARFGTDILQNSAHSSDDPAQAAAEIEFFFPSGGAPRKNTAVFSDSSCVLIKPHAVREGKAGQIVKAITDIGMDISAIAMFRLDRATAEEFFEVYKGVVNEYGDMVDELCTGSCFALEVHTENAPAKVRNFCGPSDPDIARHLRPKTLRAMFGTDKIHNAVHVTDLPEDAQLEVEYFFKILDR